VFTGIVEEIGVVQSLKKTSRGYELMVKAKKVLEGTQLGDSIATNGVCLTVTQLTDHAFFAGVSAETLKRSNLVNLKPGNSVNLERAVTPSSRLGGHFVQGHVDAQAELVQRKFEQETLWLTLKLEPDLMRYVVEKGFICLDGTSLTVVNTGEDWFSVMLVVYTQGEITLPSKAEGETINVEVDILGKYTEKLLASWQTSSGPRQPVINAQKKDIDSAFLSDHGFFSL